MKKRIATHKQKQQRILRWVLYLLSGCQAAIASRLIYRDASELSPLQSKTIDRVQKELARSESSIRFLINTL